MIELKDRISKILEYKNMSIPQFTLAIGAKTPQAIRDIKKGATKTLSASMQSKILSFMPELNPVWLLAGEGSMLLPTSNQASIRNVSEVKEGGMATLGDESPIFKDVEFEINEELQAEEDIPNDLKKCHKEIKRLRTLLTDANLQIARLKGRIEEKEGFIKMLMEKK